MLIFITRSSDGYEPAVYLVPLLVVFTFVLALAEGSQRLLDPRIAGEFVGMTQHGGGGRRTWRERLETLRPGRLWGALREFGSGAVPGIRDGVVNLPAVAVRWLRALKVVWAPVAALFVAVVAFNLLGEGLRRQMRSQTGWRWQ